MARPPSAFGRIRARIQQEVVKGRCRRLGARFLIHGRRAVQDVPEAAVSVGLRSTVLLINVEWAYSGLDLLFSHLFLVESYVQDRDEQLWIFMVLIS
jgi:hypothetical protein